jgi:hypothetical protein
VNSIRITQYVTAFGPGAIFDFSGESLIAMDVSRWRDAQCRKIRLERLERRASSVCGHPVTHFLVPPVPSESGDSGGDADFGIPYLRFPRWLFCARCRRLVRWTEDDERGLQAQVRANPSGRAVPRCPACDRARDAVLVPMRFIYVCPKGHVGDIDWSAWVHTRPDHAAGPGCRSDAGLRLEATTGAGGGLGSLRVVCSDCKAHRSLAELTKPGELGRSGTRCRGAQPWENEKGCTEQPRAEQRGSSNVYFPRLLSAIDLPVDGTMADVRSVSAAATAVQEAALRGLADFRRRYHELSPLLQPSRIRNWRGRIQSLASDLEMSVDDAIEAIKSTGSAPAAAQSETQQPCSLGDAEESLKHEEWPLLCAPHEYDFFKTDVHRTELDCACGVDQVTEVAVLREVRAFSGFSRLSPSNASIGAGGSVQRPWLPAIEVFGEGVFVPLAEASLVQWERANAEILRRRLAKVAELRQNDRGLVSTLPEPSPRFVLVHSLAHALIRQLAFECGYDTASLRERIYCLQPDAQGDGGRAGVLIYTASSDSEGSLGGLARQALPGRFANMFVTALRRASWCSSDPVCSEMESQGLGGLNRAACHACMLVTETSCTCFNTMLDRSLLIGDGSAMHGGVTGFFHGLMRGAEES